MGAWVDDLLIPWALMSLLIKGVMFGVSFSSLFFVRVHDRLRLCMMLLVR